MHTKSGHSQSEAFVPAGAAPPSLREAFRGLEDQKRAVLRDLAGWTESQKRIRLAPSSWTALEVIDHLVKVEHEALDVLRRNLHGRRKVTPREQFAAQMVFLVMRLPTRVKVPAGVETVLPSPVSDESELFARWDAVRSELWELLEKVQPDQMNNGVFRHPISGWMTLRRAITFLSVHLSHHRFQLRRIRKARTSD